MFGRDLALSQISAPLASDIGPHPLPNLSRKVRVRGRRKQWRGGRAFQRGEHYVVFAWNLRVMIYTSDVSVGYTV
jgi:hypothetical protein